MATDLVCKINECGKRPVNGRGWCNGHYLRWWRHGDPIGGRSTKQGETVQWLWASLSIDTDDCVKWPFSTTVGYGQTWWDGRPALATRVICELKHGPAPTPKHQAAHSCGKGHEGCVNHRHLRWATRKENEMDKTAHGTRGKALTPEAVVEIKALRGAMTGVAIAERYGVHPATISGIFCGKSWRGIGPD